MSFILNRCCLAETSRYTHFMFRLRRAVFWSLPVLLGLATSIGTAWVCEYRGADANALAVLVNGPVSPEAGCHVGTMTKTESFGFVHLTTEDNSISGTYGRIQFADKPTSEIVPSWAKPYLAIIGPRPQTGNEIEDMLSDFRHTQGSGWPLRCLHCEPTFRVEKAGLRIVAANALVLGDSRLGGIAELRFLPFGPIPLGLIIDTAFYGALWSIPLFGPILVRRVLRARHGRCPQCAYDLRATPTHSPCPECGTSQ